MDVLGPRGNESQTSDYSASFGDDHELALDAEKMGNEARMINDFRNTGRRANAVFDQYRDAAGDQKLGVFVGEERGRDSFSFLSFRFVSFRFLSFRLVSNGVCSFVHFMYATSA